uniref:Uncharacterized protein n=1 Tax=Plectus sambesii TaxID=2011161 RepID=A0A914VCU8_9BILA
MTPTAEEGAFKKLLRRHLTDNAASDLSETRAAMERLNFLRVCVVFLLVALVVVDAQMTFSDGWGKRSAAPLKESKPGQKLDQCNHAYSQ